MLTCLNIVLCCQKAALFCPNVALTCLNDVLLCQKVLLLIFNVALTCQTAILSLLCQILVLLFPVSVSTCLNSVLLCVKEVLLYTERKKFNKFFTSLVFAYKSMSLKRFRIEQFVPIQRQHDFTCLCTPRHYVIVNLNVNENHVQYVHR